MTIDTVDETTVDETMHKAINAEFYKYTAWIRFLHMEGENQVCLDGYFTDSALLRKLADKLDALNGVSSVDKCPSCGSRNVECNDCADHYTLR